MIQSTDISVPQTNRFDWRLAVKSSPEKPRYIIIGFQTKTDKDYNKATFQHVNLRNIYVNLGSRRYPEVDYEIDFSKNQYSRVFNEAINFKEKYYGIDEVLSDVNLTNREYMKFYPLFVLDISKQANKIKGAITDITVKAFFRENVPVNTTASATIVSDKIIMFEADGSKMRTVV